MVYLTILANQRCLDRKRGGIRKITCLPVVSQLLSRLDIFWLSSHLAFLPSILLRTFPTEELTWFTMLFQENLEQFHPSTGETPSIQRKPSGARAA